LGLIEDVRELTNAQTSDASNADIIRELERARCLVERELCWHEVQVASGSVEYKLARVKPWGQFEPGTAGQVAGTAGSGTLNPGTIRDTTGSVITGWTISRDGFIDFAADRAGSIFTFRGFSYDVHRAASALLEEMAATELRQFDVNVNGDDVKRSQKAANLERLAKLYRKRALPKQPQMVRSDEEW
jgi:hypothetical protein